MKLSTTVVQHEADITVIRGKLVKRIFVNVVPADHDLDGRAAEEIGFVLLLHLVAHDPLLPHFDAVREREYERNFPQNGQRPDVSRGKHRGTFLL